MGNSIGTRIQTLRKEANLSRKELGEFIGMSQSAIYDYESGRRSPKEDTLSEIARLFNVRSKWLKLGTGERTESEEQERKITIQTQKIAETTKIVSTADKEHFQVISELIALLPDMNIGRNKKKEYYKVLVSYRNELERKVLFGDEEAAERQARALYRGGTQNNG